MLRDFHTKLLPAIRIHSWGGFGSQLFACIVARRLSVRFPRRSIHLIFHSAGVTSRNIEVPEELLCKFKVTFRNDFTSSRIADQYSTKAENQNSFWKLAIEFLEKLGLLVRLNFESEFTRIHSHTLAVRGHYSMIDLDSAELNWLETSLEIPVLRNHFTDLGEDLTIHFRLGDLRTLTTKSHIPVNRMAAVANAILEVKEVKMFSDSPPQEVEHFLGNTFKVKSLAIFNIDSLQTIRYCTQSKYFIGTNSKISLWITILRSSAGIGLRSWLPEEMSHHLNHNLPIKKQKSEVEFY
jgi:hypothetical protein